MNIYPADYEDDESYLEAVKDVAFKAYLSGSDTHHESLWMDWKEQFVRFRAPVPDFITESLMLKDIERVRRSLHHSQIAVKERQQAVVNSENGVAQYSRMLESLNKELKEFQEQTNDI